MVSLKSGCHLVVANFSDAAHRGLPPVGGARAARCGGKRGRQAAVAYIAPKPAPRATSRARRVAAGACEN